MLVKFIIVIAVAMILLIYSMANIKMIFFLYGVVFNVCVIIAVILGVAMWGKLPQPSPQAIDVYRNKTKLQITYQDSVAVDSVVVWKDE